MKKALAKIRRNAAFPRNFPSTDRFSKVSRDYFPLLVVSSYRIRREVYNKPFGGKPVYRAWFKAGLKKRKKITQHFSALASYRFCELKDHRRSFLDFLFDCNRLRTNDEVKTGHEITDRSSKMQARDDKRSDEVMVQWKR